MVALHDPAWADEGDEAEKARDGGPPQERISDLDPDEISRESIEDDVSKDMAARETRASEGRDDHLHGGGQWTGPAGEKLQAGGERGCHPGSRLGHRLCGPAREEPEPDDRRWDHLALGRESGPGSGRHEPRQSRGLVALESEGDGKVKRRAPVRLDHREEGEERRGRTTDRDGSRARARHDVRLRERGRTTQSFEAVDSSGANSATTSSR